MNQLERERQPAHVGVKMTKVCWLPLHWRVSQVSQARGGAEEEEEEVEEVVGEEFGGGMIEWAMRRGGKGTGREGK
jgi:hypothetical protein